MNSYKLLKLLMTRVDNSLLLLLEVSNASDLYTYIYKYELYDDYLEKLFKLCHDDIDLIRESLELIDSRTYFTKEVVHTNLDFDDPIPFIEMTHMQMNTIKEFHFAMSAITFRNKYEQKLHKGPSR